MMYQLAEAGILTDRIKEFGATPPDLSRKDMVWHLVDDQTNPAHNPATHILGPVERNLIGGKAVWTQATILLTQDELDGRVAVSSDVASLVKTLVDAPVLNSTDFSADLIVRVNARLRLDSKVEI